MARTVRILVIAMASWAALCTAPPGEEPSEEIVRISSTPACSKCRIELRQVVTLGTPDDSADAQPLGTIRRDSRGEIFAISRWTPHQLAVFSASGELAALVGRRGEGPGDFRRINFLEIGPGDTVHLFDLPLRRRTLLAPGSWRVARTAPLPVVPEIEETTVLGLNSHVFFPDGRYVVNGPKGDSALHLVGAEGELARSFGAGYGEEDQPPPPSNAHLSVLGPGGPHQWRRMDVIARQIAAAPEGRVWAAYWNRYEIELWDTAGHRLRRLARDAEWYEPYRSDEFMATNRRHLLRERERGDPRAPGLPLPPFMAALQQDDRGRLWVLVWVPPLSGGPEGGRHTMVEILDPGAGRLVASARLPMQVSGFVGPGLVTVGETRESDGVEVVRVFRLALVEE